MSFVIFCSGVLFGIVVLSTVKTQKCNKKMEDIIFKPLMKISTGTQYKMNDIEESDNDTESFDIYNYNKY